MHRSLIKRVAVLGAVIGLIGGGAALASAATSGATTPSQTTPQGTPGHHCHHPGGSAGTSGASYQGGGSI